MPVLDPYGVLRPADRSLTGAGTPSPRLIRVPGPRTRFAPVLTGVILYMRLDADAGNLYALKSIGSHSPVNRPLYPLWPLCSSRPLSLSAYVSSWRCRICIQTSRLYSAGP